VDTKGIPLDFLLSSLKEKDYVIDWIEFVNTSLEHNWKLKGTIIKIEQALIDIYGREYTDIIVRKLKDLYKSV